MNRKDVIFSVFTTFCLCALMFAVIPIRSGQPYDPWADIDENGQINMYDIAYAASRFGTAGDSTKNVNVTNWLDEPRYSLYRILNVPDNVTFGSSVLYGYRVNVLGYSKMFLIPEITGMSSGNYYVNVTLSYAYWLTNEYDDNATYTEIMPAETNVFSVNHFGEDWNVWGVNMVPIETRAPYVSLQFRLSSNAVGWMLFDCMVYLRND